MAFHWPALAVMDAVTTACAGFNFLYFINRLLWLNGYERGRWAAVATLALISLALMLQGIWQLSLVRNDDAAEPDRILVSAISMAASVAVTVMIVRRFGR